MLSKCANPDCSAQFRFLHQGKIFHLNPTPEVQAASPGPPIYERFWLCDACCKGMTLVWGGSRVKLVRKPAQPIALLPSLPEKGQTMDRLRKRAASAGREER